MSLELYYVCSPFPLEFALIHVELRITEGVLVLLVFLMMHFSRSYGIRGVVQEGDYVYRYFEIEKALQMRQSRFKWIREPTTVKASKPDAQRIIVSHYDSSS